jgi:outer membrane protein OmpA-like peptidoglycan-associated protein
MSPLKQKKLRKAGLASQRMSWISGLICLSQALTPVGFANVVGSDTQNFNPITSGLDFVTVQSSETLKPGVVNFGLFLNQAYNTLPHFDSTTEGSTKYTDSILAGDLNIGIGLLPGWDIGFSAPQMIHQKVESEGFRGQFGDNGNTEIRFNTKVRLWGTDEYGVALVGSANVNRIKNNPFTGKDAGPTSNLELVMDTTIKNIALGLNLGHRWRNSGSKVDAESPIEPLGDQLIGSAALSYLFTSIDTKIIFEVFGSKPAKSENENSDRLSSTAEAIAGLKHDFTTALAGHLGAGSELIHGRGSPDFRIYAGLNYTTGPVFSAPKESTKTVEGKKVDAFAGPVQPKEKIVIHDLLFEFDSDSLIVGGADNTLKKLVAYINQKPVFTKLVIDGHTDSIGSVEYNADLSRRRANTIRKLLIEKHKVDPAKLSSFGKGEGNPIADNGNYQGRQLNRRVEFTIYRDTK